MKQIPKKIHYCWMGGNEKSELVKSCIESWRRNLKGYEFIEWNEDNFQIDKQTNEFVKEAYADKKWAFVSDYVRLWALSREGGVYLDTDVEVIKNIDFLLENEFFIGFEDELTLGSCVIGAAPNNEFINELLIEYNELKYTSNIAPNVKLITDKAILKGLTLNGLNQTLENNIKVLSKDYFSPKSYITNETEITQNTVAIHHFDGSWLKKQRSFKAKMKNFLYKKLGKQFYNKLVLLKRKMLG